MAARDKLLGYWLMSEEGTEASPMTRVDGSGAGRDFLDTGSFGYDFSVDSDFGDNSLDSPLVGRPQALSILDTSLPLDFPGKLGGTGDSYTIYIRTKTRASATGSARQFLDKSALFTSGWLISNETTNNDRDVLCRHTDTLSANHDITVTLPDHLNFHTVIMRYRGSTDDELSVWLNAVKDPVTRTPVDGPDQHAGAFFGGNSGNIGNRSMDARLDEVAVWARDLTEAEIVQLDAEGVEAFTASLVGCPVAKTGAEVFALNETARSGVTDPFARGLTAAGIAALACTAASISGMGVV
jgi:hypothetical protein